MHQFTNLSANAIPFQLQAAGPTPTLAGTAGGLQEQGRDGATSDFSPPHRIVSSPLGRLPSSTRYHCLQTSDDGSLSTDGSTTELISHKKRQRSIEVVRAAGVARAMGVLVTPTDLLPPMEEGKRKTDFLAKSISSSSVVRRVTLVM